MNTNIILDGFNAMLKQLIASAVADAVKPLQDKINMLETQVACSFDDEKKMVGDRLTALQINQSLGRAQADKVNLADLVAELVTAEMNVRNFIRRNEVIDLVETLVTNTIDNYDFNDIIDWDNKIEEGINNYDFREIVEENMPDDMVNEERVQELIHEAINEAFDNLVITRN